MSAADGTVSAPHPPLTLSHLRFHLVPEQELQLPPYSKGSTVRGGFGTAFRKLVCVDLRWECADCSLRYKCPYTKVFNPFIPPDAPQFTGNQNIPRPFVFKPPLSNQTRYAIGDVLLFDLVVVGQAVDYLPYFIVAFRELGAMGFGLNRARVQLAAVEAIGHDGAATTVYDSETNQVQPAPPMEMEVGGSRYPVHGSRYPVQGTAYPSTDYRLPTTDDVLTLEFLTPTTLKAGSGVGHGGMIVRRPAFHHILKRLRDRVNALATFYGDGSLDLDFKALGQAAEQVETVADHIRWIERSRIARRRNVTHDLSGFVGSIGFRGDLMPFLPLLRIGEYVHVGKNAVFGNGWFVIDKR